MQTLFLASSSKYRRQLLQRLRVPFTWVDPAVDEAKLTNETVVDYVQRLACGKADAVAAAGNAGYIIGSDQVTASDNQIIGKPGTLANAKQQLLQLSGQTVNFYTGVCVLNTNKQQYFTALDVTKVKYKQLTPDIIEKYLTIEPALDCAAACKSESFGIMLCESIENNDPTALIGLPLIKVINLLDEAGYNIWDAI